MNPPFELVDRVAARIRDLVRVHPGPNASRALQAGDPIILSGREAEVAAYAALEAVEDARTAETEPGTPAVRATRYEVSCLPEEHPDANLFTVMLQDRGSGRWAVAHNGACYDADGRKSWGYRWPEQGPEREPVTEAEMDDYNRARDAWLDAHRFDLATATRLAREIAPRMTTRGYTVQDALAKDWRDD